MIIAFYFHIAQPYKLGDMVIIKGFKQICLLNK